MNGGSAEEDLREVILKYTAINASKYGKADLKSVMGKILSEKPELKRRAKELVSVVREVIDEFERLDESEKLKLFERYKEERKEEKKEISLPPLPNAEKGKVVMRFAPNPNGPPTLGSVRGMIVNGEYAKMYEGRLILRFDDTDPRTKRPLLSAYEWYIENYEWLGYKPDKIIYASKRIPIYYDYIKKLIEMGCAYACFCRRDEFREFKSKGIDCPHRSLSPEESLEIWDKMLNGEYDEGEVVIRIKTDMGHKDPAIRDWVAFRIIYESHPLTGDKYCVYPTLDFESAIEDHLNGITHIIRGKDLIDSEKRQKYVYKYFNWKYPVTKHWGRVKIHEFGKLSTSSIKKEIEKGIFQGWDDFKVPTLLALRRRGFHKTAIKRFFLSLGVGENDVSVSLKNLYAENRKIIDKIANRYFFVEDPILITISGIDDANTKVELPLNPEKGTKRSLEGGSRVYISQDDFNKLREGDLLRLKDFCNLKAIDLNERLFEFQGFEMSEEVKKGKNIIHWLPEKNNFECIVISDKEHKGLVEPNVKNDVGNVVQFERFGFCRIEKIENRVVHAIFTHP